LKAPSNVELVALADTEALITHAAESLRQELHRCEPSESQYLIALPGGRTARQLFKAAAKVLSGTSLRGVHFFWGDERCVSPDDPESNFGLANEHLLGPLRIPPENVHRIRGEEAPSRAAELAAQQLQHVARSSAGFPTLDLVILGMGEDGHIASLFPGETLAAIQSPEIYRSVVAVKPPPERITLGYGMLAHARNVWVLVSGEGKRAALQISLGGSSATPLAKVLRARRLTRVLTESRLL
jgi:6-phosphogluconolactonase